MSQTLDTLTFPLTGSRLIEASAGTGKTYTIAALYLRLILCHGNEAAFSQPLLPPQILVMTFTEAATQELRDRIRARLVEAAAAFRHPDAPTDALLTSLRDDFAPANWAECAWRLDTAAQWMDESAVMTLHAWCQRMLREHAFDSGSLFDLKVKTNHQALYDQVIRDYWRTHCYTLDADGAAWVHAHWKQPDVLWQKISLFLEKMDVDLPADVTCHQQPLQTWFDRQHGHLQAELTRLKQDARSQVAEVFALLTDARQKKQFNARRLTRPMQEEMAQAFHSWLDDPVQVTLPLKPAHRKRLTVHGLQDIWNDPASAPDTPALRGLEGLADQLDALQRQHDDALLWHVIGWTRQRFVTEKRQRAEMGFVDMLLDLRDVLRSASGTSLAETIRQRFPVAMVDEFQDTDPVQYEILDAVYDLADPAPHTALVLIGDPKQSIYGFRGADIHAYLRARRATQGRHYTLPVNYRSSAAMVAAVNHLFSQAEDRPQGQGAFLYRAMPSADADKPDNPIPFHPVQAHHAGLSWQQDGRVQPALTLWHGVAAVHPDGAEDAAGQETAMQASSPDAAESCASAIVALLEDATASYTDAADTVHDIAPGDIAVLVRNRHEARKIRQALSRRGVHSVYLSNADSVYQTQEAADMQLWLTACLHPQDERCLKSALATPSLGLSLEALQRYHQDEQHWEEAVLQFAAYGERWRTQGVLPMLHQLMHDYGLPGRLMQQPAGGERALTNILHLAEVLQQQARELDGQRALLQFLQQAGDDPESVDDQQILRLESDSALLRVVTLHKAKGLEYPFVFLPFINAYQAFEHRGRGFVLSTEGRRAFHLHAPADATLHQQAEHNRLAEDLRLLYVGLTRARYGCWLGAEQPKKAVGERDRGSALSYLLGAAQPEVFGGCLQAVSSNAPVIAGSIACMAVGNFPVPSQTRYAPVTTGFEPQARVYDAAPRPPWWVASYSALLRAPGTRATAVPETAAAQVLVDDEPDPADAFPSDAGAVPDVIMPADAGSDVVIPSGIHALPRGAAIGNFLHDLLERAMQPELRLEDDAAEQRAALLEQLAERHGHETRLDVLREWMHALWHMPFALPDGQHFCLDTLSDYQVEMEFWLAAHQVDARHIDALVTQHVQRGHERPGLAPEQVNGLLKGFMDLVFSAGGSYYVLDYKSNHLGPDAASYVADNMWPAMLQHRYDLQAVLYTLALHRHLQIRISDYDYDQHIGGALYLFLRGIQGPEQGLVHLRPPRRLIEALDALFAGQPEPESS